ncbi:MAG: molecular chaperone HtpG, partial [Desulfobulbus sp.]
LGEEAKKDAEKYQKFWKVFGIFLKEGVTSDFEFQAELAKLLRFESSASEAGSMIALDEYVDRMKEGQDKIYYINGPNRSAIENGPYIEMFTKQNIEILYTLEPIDDFVLSHLGEYDGKKLVSADRSDLTLPENAVEEDASKEEENKDALASEVQQSLCKWMKEILADKVKDVKPSSRLVASPAMIVNVDGMMTSSMERIMLAQGAPEEQLAMGGKKDMEINPASPLIKKLADLRVNNEEFARDIVAQIFDNAMIQAGLLVDPQQMVNRNYRILEQMAGDK